MYPAIFVFTKSIISLSANSLFVTTIPFLSKLANKGYEKALKEDKNFLAGLNVFKGEVTYKAVADIFGHKYTSPADIIGA